MKIAMACAGEGRGHISRVIALSQELEKKHEIIFYCPDSVRSVLQPFFPASSIKRLPAFHFVLNKNGVDYKRTIQKNIPLLLRKRAIISDFKKDIKLERITGVVSDFEPFLSKAALMEGIPLINLNHPGIVRRYMSFQSSALAAQIVATFLMPLGGKNIICSFYKGDVGPIIRQEIKSCRPSIGNYYLVYTKESSRAQMEAILKRFPQYQFRIFPDKEEDFISSLAGCRAVIAPSGHQLISEALYLRKPILAFPQTGQFEQLLNARMLEYSGLGLHGNPEDPTESLTRFIKLIPEFESVHTLPPGFSRDDSCLNAVRMIEDFFLKEKRNLIDYLPTRSFMNQY